MLIAQKGACWICEKPETVRSNPNGIIDSLRVDHCHKTGKIRGLLCSECNFGLSKFKDDICLMERAIQYLKRLQ
jgi:Recombination endonuclease VII